MQVADLIVADLGTLRGASVHRHHGVVDTNDRRTSIPGRDGVRRRQSDQEPTEGAALRIPPQR